MESLHACKMKTYQNIFQKKMLKGLNGHLSPKYQMSHRNEIK